MKFSIGKTADGEQFVKVNENAIDFNDGESIAKNIARYISNEFNNLITINGQNIQINSTTNGEWRFSNSAREIRKNSPDTYNDKLKAIANADEILRAANNWINEELTHERGDDFVGFGRGNILYKVGENGYSADVLVGIRENGAAVLYDLVNIYDKNITEHSLSRTDKKVNPSSEEYSVNTNLSQNDNSVNSSISENSGENSEKTTFSLKDAEDRVFHTPYGIEVVQNPTNTEYRQMREDVYKAYPHLKETGESVLRYTYDEDGNEYYWNAYDGMHSQVEPYINKQYNTRTSQQYEWWKQEDKDDYPIKYSTRDSNGNELSEAQQGYFKDSKVRDEDGNLLVVYHGTDADFTVFDKTKTRANMDIQGNFFSPWDIDAQGYGQNVKAYYIDIKNPAPEGVAYKALNRFKGQNNAGIKAREYLESLGYDGVNNSGEEYITFSPNQIKLIDNLNPTENEDIRYSERNYWKPNMSKKDLNYIKSLSRKEVLTSDNYIDNETKWLYNSSKGQNYFAIYSAADSEEPTILFAVTGKGAVACNNYISFFNGCIKEDKNEGKARSVDEIYGINRSEFKIRNDDNSYSGNRGTDGHNASVYLRQLTRRDRAALLNCLRDSGEISDRGNAGRFSDRDAGYRKSVNRLASEYLNGYSGTEKREIRAKLKAIKKSVKQMVPEKSKTF